MEDDPQLRELTAHPKHRRVLITDIRSPVTRPLIDALLTAGAVADLCRQNRKAGGVDPIMRRLPDSTRSR